MSEFPPRPRRFVPREFALTMNSTTPVCIVRMAAAVGVLSAFSFAHAADLGGDYVWRPMKIGGGGWVTGLDINPAHKAVRFVRTDVSGAYRWEEATSSWRQVV